MLSRTSAIILGSFVGTVTVNLMFIACGHVSSGIDSGVRDALAADSPSISEVVPPGTIVAYGGDTAPPGWLICDGAKVSRVEYANLFAAIKINWGQGNNVDTFTLPDLRGRFLRGVDK